MRRTRHWGITSTQYNVLRILRVAQPQGLTCSAIGERMITAVPDTTRLLAPMKTQKFIRQQRDKKDRRVVWTKISASGTELLSKVDPEITQIPGELLGHLDRKELGEFVRLLEVARRNCTDMQTPVSCEGEICETQ
jgi:DNA-binding MarR family transcriptional regulator